MTIHKPATSDYCHGLAVAKAFTCEREDSWANVKAEMAFEDVDIDGESGAVWNTLTLMEVAQACNATVFTRNPA